MVRPSLRLAAVVLAAGAGSRFSTKPGAKLLAELDGEPLLAHVLKPIREFAPEVTVVVLGHGADEIEQRIGWAGEKRVHNLNPERGLISSIATGLKALEVGSDDYDGAFMLLGDQPQLRADVLRSLAEAAAQARPADKPLVVPHYADEQGPRNPVLLLRPAWQLVDGLAAAEDLAADEDLAAAEGSATRHRRATVAIPGADRGLAALIDERPDMVQRVPVKGAMPDVDSTADLAHLQHLRRAGP